MSRTKKDEFMETMVQHFTDARESFSQSVSMLDFFRSGFRLTADDRFRDLRIEYSPWYSTLCGWFEDPSVEWIWLVQGSQTSKTIFLMGALLYVSQFLPGAVPCLWVQSTEEEAKLFISERLRAFLDEAGLQTEKDKSWKVKAFRVNNAPVKVGYATTKSTLRSKPARFMFGDECGIWKETVSYVKKRSRTFSGKRKGFFATTPPESGKHHSWQEATAGNFYQWWVACPDCKEYQGLQFSQVKFDGKEEDTWNLEIVQDTTYYECKHCGSRWKEHQKLSIINTGKPVCVDPENHEPAREKKSDTRTLQVSSLYSVFTTWGELAADFLEAKAAGPQALRIFFTDELAEVPRETGETLRNDLAVFCVSDRTRGQEPAEVQIYTAGCDVQRKGQIYWVIVGWKPGAIVSGHVLDYGIVGWKDEYGTPNFKPLLEQLNKSLPGKLYRVGIDATDGVEQPHIFNFCRWAGINQYVPIIDSGANQIHKIQYKPIEAKAPGHLSARFFSLHINSSLVKDDIAAAFSRLPGEPGAWTLPADTCDDFFRHLRNEHRTWTKRAGKLVGSWEPRYSGAPQHWWSSLVYATAVIDDQKHRLLITRENEEVKPKEFVRYRKRGIDIWQ